MRRLLMVCFDFPPVGGAGVQRVLKFVRYLPQYGWQPIVVCADQPPHAEHDVSLADEIATGVDVVRVPVGRALHGLRRHEWGRYLLRFALLGDTYALWRARARRAAVALMRQHTFECVWTTDPASAHMIGRALRRQFGVPWVMDVRDLWTQAFTYRPVSFLHALLEARLDRNLARSATLITPVTEGFRVLLLRTAGVRPERVEVIRNGFDEADFAAPAPAAATRFTILHAGRLFGFAVRRRPAGWRRLLEPLAAGPAPAVAARSPETLLRAVHDFLARCPTTRALVCVKFVGVFPDRFRALIDACGLRDVVQCAGYVSHAEAVRQMRAASVLCLMQAGAGSEVVVPGKLYEYFRAGAPVLALLPEGEAAGLVRAARAGVVLDPRDVAGVSRQLEQWFACWRAGQPLPSPDASLVRQFDRRQQSGRLAAVLERAVGLGAA